MKSTFLLLVNCNQIMLKFHSSLINPVSFGLISQKYLREAGIINDDAQILHFF